MAQDIGIKYTIMNYDNVTINDVSILRYTEYAQKGYMILVSLAVVLASFIDGFVNELISISRSDEVFSFESFYFKVKAFYPYTESPVSFLLNILTFLSTIAITLAVIAAKGERELMLSKLSYWLCVGSDICLVALMPCLFNELGAIKSIFIIVTYNIITYYLGRISIIISKATFAESKRKFNEKTLSVYQDLYKKYDFKNLFPNPKKSVKIVILVCFFSFYIILIVEALLVLSIRSAFMTLYLFSFLFVCLLALISIIKNEEDGKLFVAAISLSLLSMTETLLLLVWSYRGLFITLLIYMMLYVWIFICATVSRISFERYNSFIERHPIAMKILYPVIIAYTFKSNFYKKRIIKLEKQLN